MNPRYDELERLQRLRRSGALTDAEFRIEKQRVLAHDSAPEVEEEPERSGLPPWVLYLLIGGTGLAVAVALGVWFGRVAGGGRPDTSVANVVVADTVNASDENLLSPPPAPDVRTLAPGEQLSRAFEAAFGSAGSASLQVAGRTILYRPGRLIWAGDRAILLSPGAATDNCRACAGTLAVHYLQAAADGFHVTGSWPDAVSGPGGGAPPKWKLTSAFTLAPAIYEQGGSTGQGCTIGAVTITELAPGGPVQSGPIRMVYSDSAAPAGDDADNPITGRIANIHKDQSFDVVYSAAEPFTETWTKQGSRFVLQGGETKVPSC